MGIPRFQPHRESFMSIVGSGHLFFWQPISDSYIVLSVTGHSRNPWTSDLPNPEILCFYNSLPSSSSLVKVKGILVGIRATLTEWLFRAGTLLSFSYTVVLLFLMTTLWGPFRGKNGSYCTWWRTDQKWAWAQHSRTGPQLQLHCLPECEAPCVSVTQATSQWSSVSCMLLLSQNSTFKKIKDVLMTQE